MQQGQRIRATRQLYPETAGRVTSSPVVAGACSRRSTSNPTLVERFFIEARAVNLIRHENIVNVMDLDTLSDGRPYIVMEYLDGASSARRPP